MRTFINLIMLTAVIFVVGCVTKKEYTACLAEKEELQQKNNQAIQAQLDQATTLTQIALEYEDAYKKLNSDHNTLLTTHGEAKKKLADANTKIKKLGDTVSVLKNSLGELEKTLSEKNATLAAATEKNHQLEQENQELKGKAIDLVDTADKVKEE